MRLGGKGPCVSGAAVRRVPCRRDRSEGGSSVFAFGHADGDGATEDRRQWGCALT